MIGHRRSNAIDDAAAAWVARRDRDALDARAEAEFDAWLAADARHLGAYARAEAVFAAFDRARALQAPAPYEPPRASRRAVLGWSASAAAAAALAGVLLVGEPARPPGARYASALGQLRTVVLADGSRMTLGTGAETIVRIDARERRIALRHGAALFDVARDPGRRFVVTAGEVSVFAVGTSFSVDRGDAGGTILVRHGIVAVAHGRAGGLRRVDAGNRVAWLAARPGAFDVTPVDERELRRALAWTQGMLAFEGRTMAEATAEFARYSDFRILIADPALAQRKVTGWFSTQDPRGFAHAAAASLGAVAEDRDNAVIIRPAS